MRPANFRPFNGAQARFFSSLSPRGDDVLKAGYDKEDDIPEKHRELFTERDGRFELTGIQGLRTPADVTRIEESLRKERSDHKKTKTQLGSFQTLGSIEEVTEMHDQFPELKAKAEATGGTDDEKIEAQVTARMNSKLKPLERQLSDLQTASDEKDVRLGDYETRDRQRTISTSIRKAAEKQKGFEPTAIEDAILLGQRVLHISEDNRVETKDGVGVTPGVDAAMWLDEIAPTKPHWFGTTKGGGARGSESTASANNPFSSAGWNITQQGEVMETDPARADKLAKQAGFDSAASAPTAPPPAK